MLRHEKIYHRSATSTIGKPPKTTTPATVSENSSDDDEEEKKQLQLSKNMIRYFSFTNLQNLAMGG
jgi:hypothetical protein